MRDYPAIFHLHVCRARSEIDGLKSLLDKFHECCQADENGNYKDIQAVDSESLEKLEILSQAVNNECRQAVSALQWHNEKNR